MFGIFDFIARPLGQLLMTFYDFTGSYGLALILFAVAVKVVLLPFQMKAKKGTMRQSRLQPKMQELQKKHGTNKQKINEEMAKLYKEEGVNPASGCIWGILPFPIMIALFQAIRQPLAMMMNIPDYLIEEGGRIYERLNEVGFESTAINQFYLELEQTQFISAHFDQFREFVQYGLQQLSFNWGPVNLGQQPQWTFFWHESTDWSYLHGWLPGLILFLLPLLSGGMQFINAHITRKVTPQMPQQEGAGKSMQTMMMMMPLMSVFFGFTLPAALSVYWTTGTVLQIFQDLWLNKKYTKILDAEDEVRNKQRKAKEAEIEAKRIETERKKAEGIIEENKNKSKRNKQKEEKQEKREKAAEWEKKTAPPSDKEEVYEPSRVGKRKHARGRAYDPDRYGEQDDGMDEPDDDERIPELEEADTEESVNETDDLMDEEEMDGDELDDEEDDSDDDEGDDESSDESAADEDDAKDGQDQQDDK